MLSDIPNSLASGPITLSFDGVVTPDSHDELVPYYHFKIRDTEGSDVGHINLRVGDTRHVTLFAGHIGFQIDKAHRGRSYALHACLALAPLIRKHYTEVILTADPNNEASLRVLEKLGATFIEELEVPADDPSYASGARRKRRYRWAA